MRVGLALPHYDSSLAGRSVEWEALRRVATRAAAGFDSLWVSDHLFLDWGKYGGSTEPHGAMECWTTLSALAASTRGTRLGSLTLCNDLRNPALLAKMIATLDLLSGGERLVVGIGAGWYEPEYRAAGITFDRPSARIARLKEAVEIVRRLLDGEELTYEGRHYRLDGAICRPRPEVRPPIWIGGKGDRLLATAASVADGWNFSWIGDMGAYRERAARADAECEKLGRDPADLTRSIGVYVVVGADEKDVRRRWERVVERAPRGVFSERNGRSAVSLDDAGSAYVVGTVEQVATALAGLTDLGVEEVILGLGAVPFQTADEEDVVFAGEELVPALHEIGGRS